MDEHSEDVAFVIEDVVRVDLDGTQFEGNEFSRRH